MLGWGWSIWRWIVWIWFFDTRFKGRWLLKREHSVALLECPWLSGVSKFSSTWQSDHLHPNYKCLFVVLQFWTTCLHTCSHVHFFLLHSDCLHPSQMGSIGCFGFHVMTLPIILVHALILCFSPKVWLLWSLDLMLTKGQSIFCPIRRQIFHQTLDWVWWFWVMSPCLVCVGLVWNSFDDVFIKFSSFSLIMWLGSCGGHCEDLIWWFVQSFPIQFKKLTFCSWEYE